MKAIFPPSMPMQKDFNEPLLPPQTIRRRKLRLKQNATRESNPKPTEIFFPERSVLSPPLSDLSFDNLPGLFRTYYQSIIRPKFIMDPAHAVLWIFWAMGRT